MTFFLVLEGEENAVLAYLKSLCTDKSIGILCYDEEIGQLQPEGLFPVGSQTDLDAQAKSLFSALRKADGSDAEIIYAHLPPMNGIGLALYNRMIRAAAHTVKTLV